MTTIDIIKANLKEAKAYFPSHYQLKLWKAPQSESYDNEFGEGHYDLSKGDPKLEGTVGEHWSPAWETVVKKYQLADGSTISPEEIPAGEWITIQTPPEEETRRKSGITWAMDSKLISNTPFEVNGLTIDPETSMLCMADNGGKPTLEWGCWPVNKSVFANTYTPL